MTNPMVETYKFDCHGCGREIEIGACPPESVMQTACPMCGVALCIHWRPSDLAQADRGEHHDG